MRNQLKEVSLLVFTVLLLFFVFHYQAFMTFWYEDQAAAAYALSKYDEQVEWYTKGGATYASHFGRAAAHFKQQQYDLAKEIWEELLSECEGDECFQLRYNLGNTQVELGRGYTPGELQQETWETGLDYYDRALSIVPDDEQTLHNKAMLERLLDQLEQEQQKQQQDQQGQGENQQDDTGQEGGSGDQGQEQSGSQESGGESDEDGEETSDQGDQGQEQGQEGEEESGEEGSTTTEGEERTALTDDERAELEAYQDQLQQQQRQAQEFFNKQSQPGQPTSMMDVLFGPPQFEQGLNANSSERDW